MHGPSVGFHRRLVHRSFNSDPELSTHRAYGLPRPIPTPELLEELKTVRINPQGVLPEPLPVADASAAIAKLDGYAENETDRADTERQWP